MNKYEIIIYWSDEDQSFVADVPELPGCMAHGNTYESALENVSVQQTTPEVIPFSEGQDQYFVAEGFCNPVQFLHRAAFPAGNEDIHMA